MKKILCSIVAVLLLLPCLAIAESLNLSSMPTEDLLALREEIDNEIEIRVAKEQEKIILFEDPAGMTIYLSGKTEVKVGKSIALEFIIVNNGNEAKSCYYYTEAVNGWVSRKWKTMAKELEPGRKTKDTITFYDDEYVDSYEEPIVLEFELLNGDSAFDNGDSLGKFKLIYSYGQDTLSIASEK